MQTTENDTKTENLAKSKLALFESEKHLSKLAKTCCIDKKSLLMQNAFHKLQRAMSDLENEDTQEINIPKGQESLKEFGAVIGQMNVSCCTEVREPLYRQLFKSLNSAHTYLDLAMGHGH